MQHLHDFPHDLEGNNGVCEMCNVFIGPYKVPFEGLNEPMILLCDTCLRIPNSKEHVRAKRRAEFPPDKTVKSF